MLKFSQKYLCDKRELFYVGKRFAQFYKGRCKSFKIMNKNSTVLIPISGNVALSSSVATSGYAFLQALLNQPTV